MQEGIEKTGNRPTVEAEKPANETVFIDIANGETEAYFLNVLSKDGAGKPLHYFFDLLREFGHSGSSIDQIGHGHFVIKTETVDAETKRVVDVDFIPWDKRQEAGVRDNRPGHYKLLGAEKLLRRMMELIYERIEKEGSETAKRDWIGENGEYRKKIEEMVRKYYPDERQGMVEFDMRGYGGDADKIAYKAKRISYSGKIVEEKR
jgi:hypothetical protein